MLQSIQIVPGTGGNVEIAYTMRCMAGHSDKQVAQPAFEIHARNQPTSPASRRRGTAHLRLYEDPAATDVPCRALDGSGHGGFRTERAALGDESRGRSDSGLVGSKESPIGAVSLKALQVFSCHVKEKL